MTVSYHDVNDLLVSQLGFQREEKQDTIAGGKIARRWLEFVHTESDTVIVLPFQEDGVEVNQDDLYSIETRLFYRGLLSREEFQQFVRNHTVKAAS